MILIYRSIRNIFILSTLLLTWQESTAQYTTIGPVTFTSNTYGPMVCRTDSANAFSRHAYIYPASTLGDLAHGDSIRMIEFFKTNTSVYAGSPNFKMFIGMSDSADFGAGNIQSWSTETSKSGVKKVFDGSIQSIVDATTGYKPFVFDSLFVFDTTQGSHLKIFVEFYQNAAQPVGLIPLWAYEKQLPASPDLFPMMKPNTSSVSIKHLIRLYLHKYVNHLYGYIIQGMMPMLR